MLILATKKSLQTDIFTIEKKQRQTKRRSFYSCVSVDGKTSDFIELLRGFTQGDHFSSFLHSHLGCFDENDQTRQGDKDHCYLPKVKINTLCFADDLSFLEYFGEDRSKGFSLHNASLCKGEWYLTRNTALLCEKTSLKLGRLKPPIFFGSLILSSLILGLYLVDSLKTGFFPNRNQFLHLQRRFSCL